MRPVREAPLRYDVELREKCVLCLVIISTAAVLAFCVASTMSGLAAAFQRAVSF